ncbi:MAG TPA: hypothetical protein VGF30_13830 [Bacteroidia bacterium]
MVCKKKNIKENMRFFTKWIVFLLFFFTRLFGQDSDIKRLIDGELKMTFPGIYFKHNSTDYAVMPYTADSCFKYNGLHIKDINDLVIWRDSLESEKLTQQRIKKLKTELRKYKVTGIHIESMGEKQKISRRTMEMSADSTEIGYLLTLNSVFEIAKTRLPGEVSVKKHKKWQLPCWMNLQLNKAGRKRCKMERRSMRERAKK